MKKHPVRQPIIESSQYVNNKEFCEKYSVSPNKLAELVREGKIGGIRISNTLYYDISNTDVIRKALSYKHDSRSRGSGGKTEKTKSPKYESDFDRDLELNWRQSMKM
jgi:hypothetical protein